HLRISYSSSSASYKCKYRVELLLGHWVLEFQTPVGFNYCTKHLSRFSGVSKANLTDLTSPYTWYPNARRKNRRVILHSSSSGIYCGPLRLLAWEVSKRMNRTKVSCILITGQEQEEVNDAKHKAVTVEMADVTSDYECAMIGCQTRGFSFTRALLRLSADELHLWRCCCCSSNPRNTQSSRAPLELYSNIRKGDCIVAFSRQKVYKLKKQIESGGKHLCSVVYGSLPPQTRTKQATMFNDASSEMDVLVASDAIGMGLNLNILRIIFSTLKKFDGEEMQDLTVSEIKQIADYSCFAIPVVA
ncbi:Helicase, C-terminal, partial [Dillenia turbinata]